MNMDLLKETKELCSLYHIKPSPTKGQNFLLSSLVYDKIVEAARIKKTDIVMEVGPGLGFLTMALADQAKQVIAVELDDKLVEILPDRFRSFEYNNITIVHDNVLNWTRLRGLPEFGEFKIVANLPYNISSIFLRKFLTSEHKPTTMTLMLQDEVARRIAAKSGDMSLLALSVQYYANVEYLFKVMARDFYPAPKVNSAVVQIVLKSAKDLPLNEAQEKLFFRLAKIGFSSRRKILKSNLLNVIKIKPELMAELMTKNNISLMARAQDLSVADWLGLLGSLVEYMV
jgi:16S rRNA (adenine1518-N6/adenine1519-N6)-dimethyltransferase